MRSTREVLSGRGGFTLIEMLIVVVILGILAAVVVPQISVSTDDAKLNTLKTDLTQIRAAMEIYYAQHGVYPGYNKIDGARATSHAECATAFEQQMTRYTDADGTVASVKDATHKYGPYLKALPTNPFNNLADIVCDFDEDDITVKASSGNAGWKVYAVTGVFMADDGNNDTL
jgi:general secretion pathway protein G